MNENPLRDGVPIPLGPAYGREAVHDPLVTYSMADATAIEATEAGWPTVVVGEVTDQPVGVGAVYDPAFDESVAEVDLVLDAGRNWWAFVEFADRDAAASRDYAVDDFDGAEPLPLDAETDRWELLRDCVERGVTPVFFDQDDPSNPAYAAQRAVDLGDLAALFGFGDDVADRGERLRNAVVPDGTRWAGEESLTDLVDDREKR